MAREFTYVYYSDKSGDRLEEKDVKRVRLGWKNTDYNLVLSERELAELEDTLNGLVRGAERMDDAPRRRSAGGSGRPAGELAKIRKWARENGYEVSDRGRIAIEIQEAYDKAN